jgi:hypothetical protein
MAFNSCGSLGASHRDRGPTHAGCAKDGEHATPPEDSETCFASSPLNMQNEETFLDEIEQEVGLVTSKKDTGIENPS